MLVCCANFSVKKILFIFEQVYYSVLINPYNIKHVDTKTNNQLAEFKVKFEHEVLTHSNDTNKTESKVFFVKQKLIFYVLI